MNALELNAMYGSITREIFDIHDVELLHQLQQYISSLRKKNKVAEVPVSTKQDILDDFQEACKEYHLHKTSGQELLDFDTVLKAI